jgi:hypothetical protein
MLSEKLKAVIRSVVKEMSATGTGASYTPGSGIATATPIVKKKNTAKNANQYFKAGYKLVNSEKLAKNSKAVDTKKLWVNEEGSDAKFNIDDYVNSLNIEDEKLKKHIAGKIGDYDQIEAQLNNLKDLLVKAKYDTINYYKENPSYDIKYSTSTAKEYLDDLIELFQPKQK